MVVRLKQILHLLLDHTLRKIYTHLREMTFQRISCIFLLVKIDFLAEIQAVNVRIMNKYSVYILIFFSR